MPLNRIYPNNAGPDFSYAKISISLLEFIESELSDLIFSFGGMLICAPISQTTSFHNHSAISDASRFQMKVDLDELCSLRIAVHVLHCTLRTHSTYRSGPCRLPFMASFFLS